MRLNSIQPAAGARGVRKRVGRGTGSGLGKTCGRGHKGQKSRSGGYHKVGFEGGQMPLQRRLPKRGFRSPKLGADVVDLAALKQARIVPLAAKRAKIIASGELTAAVTVRGVAATAGARAAIENAGGKVED